MGKSLWTMAALSGALLVSACTSAVPAETPSEAGSGLVGVTWLLEDLGGKAPIDGSPVTVHFADDGAIFGSGGCNRFSGTYESTGTDLTVGESMPATMMACADDVMALETSFLTALTEAGTFAVDKEALTLSDTSGTVLATFAAQSQELTGTSWNLTGYSTGEALVSLIADTEATIAFSDDGTISGTGGCNRLLGSYTAADGTLTFDGLASTAMACPAPDGLMEQEAAITEALENAATYSIDGDALEIRTADDAVALRFVRA